MRLDASTSAWFVSYYPHRLIGLVVTVSYMSQHMSHTCIQCTLIIFIPVVLVMSFPVLFCDILSLNSGSSSDHLFETIH